MLHQPISIEAKAHGPHRSALRRSLPALILLLALPATAGQDRVWAERFRLFPVLSHYSCGFYGQQFMISVFLLENGPEGRRMGFDNRDSERDVCPCVPRADRDFAQSTQAFHRALETWVLSDEWRRREFIGWWSRFYHANGPEADKAYAMQAKATWKRAGNWMREHGMDKLKTCDLKAFSPCAVDSFTGTVWTP